MNELFFLAQGTLDCNQQKHREHFPTTQNNIEYGR